MNEDDKILAELDPNDPTRILLHDMPYMLKDLCNTIPGLRFDSKTLNGTWHIKTGWANCLAIRTTFKDRLVVGPNLNAWAVHEKAVRIDPCLALRDALDAPGLESLYPFQRAGVAFLKTAGRALLADDTGTGKTRQSIVTLMEHYKDGVDPFPALIVCPNSVKKQWAREIEAVWPGLIVTEVKGTITQRRKQLKTPSHIYIINWEAVKGHSSLVSWASTAFVKCVECGGDLEKITEAQCQVHVKELNLINFNSVIADEAHRMKNGASLTTRAVKSATGDANIRIALTGTPIADTLEDLWSILNWLWPNEWPGKSKFLTRTVESTFDQRGFYKWWGVKSTMRDEFFASFHPIMRRMTKEVVLPFLPPVVRERRDIEMSPKQKKAYIQMRDHMLAELDDGVTMAVTSPMTVTQRLLAFASSFCEAEFEPYQELDEKTGEMVDKVHTHITLINPSNKVDAFMDDIEDFGTDQVIVFATAPELLKLLGEKMDAKGIKHGFVIGGMDEDEKQNYIDRFQDGKLQFILVTTSAGGTGLTLTAANTAVYLQRPWSMIEDQQSEGRNLRIGSEIHESITYIDYVSTDTVDELVLLSREGKLDRLEDLVQDKELYRKFISGELIGELAA